MKMNFKKINNLLGWGTFLFALTVYTLTVEPSASLWDCGEYISTSIKFQVGHPPGAPLFQIMGALIGHLTSDPTNKAFLMNMLSVIYSAFGIMFLFWVITYFSKKLLSKTKEVTKDSYLIIFGSGLVGAIGFTFTDTYWFNAVESEVYAMMNCFTVMIFWLVTKWDRNFGKKGNDKLLILISLLVGLSPSIRFTLILVIPSTVMLYYFNTTKEITRKGFIKANLIGFALMMFIFQILFPFLFKYFASLDLFFVNSLGMPFNSGVIFGVLLLLGGIIYGLKYTYEKGKDIIYKTILSLLFILIGFSCYSTLVIRSNANPSINENNPSSYPLLSSYYHREQYGRIYNFWGPMFTAELDKRKPYLDGNPTYEKNKQTGKYEMIEDGKSSVPNFDIKHTGFFPRMFSRDARHIGNYKIITGVTGKKRPTLAENIKFFIAYQEKYMYFRYLFWNFVGKQNDKQGHYDGLNGNWLSGISFIDELNAGPQDNLPKIVEENNARNTYYFLPLILVIIGMTFHYKRDSESFYSVLLFFLLTGVGIIAYTNAKPFEPRERHYVFAVSFWAFSIWMGIGVLGSYEFLKQKMKGVNLKALSLGVIFIWSLAVPVLLAKENWADHDRSNRYVAIHSAKAYLDSCEKDAILFVYGDNDTFALWYAQEIEGYRRDIRVVNTSLFETDWYIDQMKTQYYSEMKPVPSQLTHKQYRIGTRDILYYKDIGLGNKRLSIKQFVDFISGGHPASKMKTQSGKDAYIYPAKNLRIPVDKQKIISKGYVSKKNEDKILDYIDFTIGGNHLTKKGYMSLDIIANNNWDRPIYFAYSSGGTKENTMWLNDYLQLEGFAYKLVPIKTVGTRGEIGLVDTEKSYNNFKKWDYGNLNEITMTYDADRRIASAYRSSLSRIGKELAKEDKFEKAKEVCNTAMEKIPLDKYGVDYYVSTIIDNYYKCNDTVSARKLMEESLNQLETNLEYFSRFRNDHTVESEKRYQLSYFQNISNTVIVNDKEKKKFIDEKFSKVKEYLR